MLYKFWLWLSLVLDNWLRTPPTEKHLEFYNYILKKYSKTIVKSSPWKIKFKTHRASIRAFMHLIGVNEKFGIGVEIYYMMPKHIFLSDQ